MSVRNGRTVAVLRRLVLLAAVACGVLRLSVWSAAKAPSARPREDDGASRHLRGDDSLDSEQGDDKVEVGGFFFDKQLKLKEGEGGGIQLDARSASHLKIFGMSVACGVLYLPSDVQIQGAEDILNPDVPKTLQVKYVKRISGDQFRWVTSDSVKGNGYMDETVRSGLEEFNPLYQDVGHGDTYTISYSPGDDESARSTLSLNGDFLGSVTGRAVSEAIFSVWFGEYVWFNQMRDDLLDGAAEISAMASPSP
eukprot:TRINITY_DN83676_c0_g1_i1.p1 TRINITY_DN83676_c0_g1~~TRINITY_DN83676_c0_g1_i1.p1  ORF type:complete len:252 (-),score=32.56 TRINITY_DN83676_c0_g1_i1:283-1038(-)